MRHAKLSLILVAAFLAAAYVAYHHPHLIRAQASQGNKVACCGANAQVGPREIDFPYYSLRDGFNSTLLLVSDSPHAIDLNVAVRGLLGETVLVPMSIQPQEKLTIDVAKLLAKQGADITGAFAEGSIAVYFIGTIMPVVGQLTMTNPATHLIHESEMVENDPGRSDIPAILNGLWWNISPGRDARIMVSNTSGNAVTASVFLDFQGQRHPVAPLMFSPHETKVLSITQLLGSLGAVPAEAPEGGITIIQHEPHPSLIAQGKILDPVTGFSTSLNFPSPEVQHLSALHASGVPIGTPSKDSPFRGMGSFTPRVIVRNLSATPQTVTITVEYPTNAPSEQSLSQSPNQNSGNSQTHVSPPLEAYIAKGSGQTTVAPLMLAPYATEDFSLDTVMSDLPLPLPYCSIRVQYSGPPGSAMAEVSSVEQRNDLVIDSRVANEGDGWAGSGGHPWHLDNETDSVLFLTDMGDKPARIGFEIQANGVGYYLTKLQLNPHETRAIDIRHLRDAQVPDFAKNKIPANATDGSILWVRADNVPVMGRLVVIQRHKSVASNYDCTLCNCGLTLTSSAIFVSPTGSTIFTGNTEQLAAVASERDCNGHIYPTDVAGIASWNSNNTSVATVSGGSVTGQGVGNADISASYNGCGAWSLNGYTCQCNSPVVARGRATVSVQQAVPTNFAQVGPGTDIGAGELFFHYTWQSSSGSLSDLSRCVVYEVVNYQGGSPFYWPKPPWNTSTDNPTVGPIPGTAGKFDDTQGNGNNSWTKPYQQAGFTATQYYRYTCNGGAEVTMSGPLSIVRSVTQNSDGTFKYQVTKSGSSAVLNPLP